MRSLLRFLVLVLLALVAATATASEEAAVPSEEETAVPSEPALVASIEIQVGVGKDQNEKCSEWAESGECEQNPSYMLSDCQASCKVPRMATATVYEGEDAAVGAFRFAEEFMGSDYSPKIIEVVQQLEDALSSEYKKPKELTHCGKRPCSAGKLWKRAEEMRKADMQDQAGADLIRALLKTGIEVDFREKCQRHLGWALQSIGRQRERERREAVEEAALQKRAEEERQAMEAAIERKKEYEADWVKFGQSVQQSVADGTATATETNTATMDAEGNVQVQQVDVDELTNKVKTSFVEVGPQGGNWNETIQIIRKLPAGDKTIEVLLIEARCQEMLGHYKQALSAAGRLISKAANYDPWINDSPRMMAATLGANAAMQLGLSENALSFYQTVLKFDPEQARARKQYRGLKKVVKLMTKADEQIEKGYNKAASGFVNDCLSAMRGLDVDSPLFRSKIQLKQCTILSAMNKHEEALSNCDAAVELRSGHDSVSPAMQKEAHLVRGEALLLDMDYDEAVQDFRAAFDLVPEHDETGEKRELQQKLRQTMHQQGLWNGGQKDGRFNEHTGYPDGRPPQRDHAKILQLPIDLEERSKDIKCAWLRKQFKTLVRKFHPDKYKGNKKRAARKFKEVKDAKDIISDGWGC